MRYYERYVERLKESLARAPLGEAKVAVIALFDAFPAAERFQMVQEVQRVLATADPSEIDFTKLAAAVKQALEGSQNAARFKERLWAIVGSLRGRSSTAGS